MRYKGRFLPSDLLSPTTFAWHSINNCIPHLDKNKYSTFEDTPQTSPAPSSPDLDVEKVRILVVYQRLGMVRQPGLEGKYVSI